jgi:hypothetical protein
LNPVCLVFPNTNKLPEKVIKKKGVYTNGLQAEKDCNNHITKEYMCFIINALTH